MKNPLKKITIIFVLIASLPVGFIAYELSSLNENEKIVREIYHNQLDAILYSVNQYTDDVISNWANRIVIETDKHKNLFTDTATTSAIRSMLEQLSTLDYIYFTDLKGAEKIFSTGENSHNDTALIMAISRLVSKQEDRIERLIAYQQAGFRKMQALDTTLNEQYLPVLFVLDGKREESYLGVMLVDLPVFIDRVLAPKMQAIAQDKFIISAIREKDDSVVLSTGVIGPSFPLVASTNGREEDSQKKAFWLLPGYYLAIALNGATLDDLVSDRVNTSLVILIMLLLVLITGIVFLYRNISREIALSQAKSEFVSNVSHEIRTPLSLISMYAETLEMGRASEEKKKEYYGVIAKEAARLSGIVNRILNFSRVESNQKKYEMKTLDLNEICAGVLDSYVLHLREKGFTCKFTREENLQPVLGDKDAIAEAVSNLVDNAIKYSRDDKHIEIKTGNDKGYNYVEVSDKGIGIAKNHQTDIFEQFYRAPISDVHNTKGSGLGLTLVKKTIEAHHGKIKVESSLGNGSTFRLYFPAKTTGVA